jgi:hypothetical protein
MCASDSIGVEVGKSKWSSVYDRVLLKMLSEYEAPDLAVHRQQLESGMKALWDSPYTEETAALLAEQCPDLKGHEAVEKARQVIFCPWPADMSVYAKAFADPMQKKGFRYKLITVFYTVHRHDNTLLERFLVYGGLESLAILSAEDNNYVQSQALETATQLFQLNVCPSPGHPKPHSGREQGASFVLEQTPCGPREAYLHHAFYKCMFSGSLLPNMAKILQEKQEVFPNSHEQCMLLASNVLAWLRAPPGEMGIPLPSLPELSKGVQAFLDSSIQVHPQTRQSAEDFFRDLRDFGSSMKTDPLPTDQQRQQAWDEALGPAHEAQENATYAWRWLKQTGTEAFKAGKSAAAEDIYQLAVEAGGDRLPGSEASLLLSNRALALIKCSRYPEAAEAAARALEFDPTNAKAAFRRAQALLEDTNAKTKVLRQAVEAAEAAVRLEPKDVKAKELMEKAHSRMREAEERGEIEDEEHTEVSEELDGMD